MSDEPKILPTRTGKAIGHASERTMADKVHSEGIRTVIRDNMDGTKTRLKTREGFLEYVTEGEVSKKEDGPACGWSYDFYPVKTVDGALVPDLIAIDGYSYPNMNFTAGAKTRRYGLTKVGGVPALKAKESHYDGIDEEDTTSIAGPFYWYTKHHVVTWTRYSYVPGDKYPNYVSLGVIRTGGKKIQVVAPSDSGVSTHQLIAACLVKSPGGTPFVRAAIAISEDGTGAGTRRIEMWDYTSSGGKYQETVLATGMIPNPSLSAAWSPDGLRLLVGEDSHSRLGTIYTVTRPDTSATAIEVTQSQYTTTIPWPEKPVEAVSATTSPIDPVSTSVGTFTMVYNASIVSSTRVHEESVNVVTGEVVVSYDNPVAPLQTRERNNESFAVQDELGGSSTRWVSSVGFKADGTPCAVVHTEVITTHYRKETRLWKESDHIYGDLFTFVQTSMYYPWELRTTYATCLSESSRSLDASDVREENTTNVKRAVHYIEAGVSVWSKEHELSLVTNNQSAGSTETKAVGTVDFSTAIQTSTNTTTTNNSSSSHAERGHITLDNVVADYFSDKIAVFWHEPLKESVKTSSAYSSVVTGNITVLDTASLAVLSTTPISTSTSSNESSPDFQKPEVIPAHITRLQLSQAKDQVTDFQFNWNNYGLAGYRSYFAGSAAWCQYGNAWLFVSRWPTSDYVGYLCKKNDWQKMVLNPAEPVAVYGGKTPWFAFTNLCPFR